jgi:alpha-amylase/alpha-mannosidase (GH57 family)
MKTALIIHGHFYQPPRENPWTEIVDREPGARPFHDWNERIYSECYRPNGYARIIDGYGRIELIVNNYVNLSFNFGPTLLSWLEREHPETYARILEADRQSARRRGGHGNAIAQSYNHTILPLSNERDRRTQVRWGLRDFRYRFGREAEAMWLPETACDDVTLETLIEEGLRYVILSPYQAERVRPARDGGEWLNVDDGQIDTTRAYKYLHRDGSRRSIAVFFYDGPIAKAIAFDGALASSQGLVDRFERAARGDGSCVNVATDGETYGHHFHWGDRTLAYALEVEAPAHRADRRPYGIARGILAPPRRARAVLGRENPRPHFSGNAAQRHADVHELRLVLRRHLRNRNATGLEVCGPRDGFPGRAGPARHEESLS